MQLLTKFRGLFFGRIGRAKKILGFTVYTDGSHKGGHGAWAYVIVSGSQIFKEGSGYCKNGDSTRMEFQAAIEALRFLPEDSQIHLHTDSRVLIENMTKRIPEWKAHGWKTKRQREIPNVDLLQELDSLNQTRQISWQWVRAHSGVVLNERCDALCVEARSNS